MRRCGSSCGPFSATLRPCCFGFETFGSLFTGVRKSGGRKHETVGRGRESSLVSDDNYQETQERNYQPVSQLAGRHRVSGGANRDSDDAHQRLDRAYAISHQGLFHASWFAGHGLAATTTAGLRSAARPAALSRHHRQARYPEVGPRQFARSLFTAVVSAAVRVNVCVNVWVTQSFVAAASSRGTGARCSSHSLRPWGPGLSLYC